MQPPERDLEKEFERGANRLFYSLFYGKRGTLERFLRKVATQQPDFVEILSEVVKRLTEEGGGIVRISPSKRARKIACRTRYARVAIKSREES